MTNENDAAPQPRLGGCGLRWHTRRHTKGGWVGAASSSLVRPPGHPGGEMPGDRHPACQPGGGAAPPPAQTYSRRRSPWTRRANETTWATSGRAPLMSAHVHMSERPCAPTTPASSAQSGTLDPRRRRQAFRIFIGLSLLAVSAPGVHRAKRQAGLLLICVCGSAASSLGGSGAEREEGIPAGRRQTGCLGFLKLASLRPVRPPSADAHVVASRNSSENAVSDPTYEANYRNDLQLSGPVPIDDALTVKLQACVWAAVSSTAVSQLVSVAV